MMTDDRRRRMKASKFAWQVVTSRWFVIAAGLWIQSVAGTSYTFGVYSQSLKDALGYDQQRLDTLAFFKGIGGNVGVISGLLYDIVPPWVVLIIGAVQNSFGYFMLWLAVTRRISPPPFWQMCIYICVACNTATFFSTAVVVTNVKNFPRNRGIIIGLLKGFLGLSGAILTQVFYAVYRKDPSSFLLMVSWLPTVVALLFMAVIRAMPAAAIDDKEHVNFTLFSTIAIGLAAYLCGVIVLENVMPFGRVASLVVVFILLAFLLLPFGVVLRSESAPHGQLAPSSITKPLLSDRHSSDIINDPEVGGGADQGRQPEVEGNQVTEEAYTTTKKWREPERGDDYSLKQATSSLDFWLLIITMTCSMGSGTTAIDNMGQIGASLGYSQVNINTFISLISIWNFLGRFGAGVVSELLLHTKNISRPCCLALSLASMCVGHLVMASAVTGSLYVGSIILGVCYGAQWSLMPAITSEIFGLRHFGTLFNTIGIASPVGGYILSVRVAGFLYDQEAQRQHRNLEFGDDDPLSCHGPSCFRLTFLILACVCALGCAVCLWLFVRTKRFYHELHNGLHKNN